MENDSNEVQPGAADESEWMLEDTNIIQFVSYLGEGFRGMADIYSSRYNVTFEEAVNLVTSDKVVAIMLKEIRARLLSDVFKSGD